MPFRTDLPGIVHALRNRIALSRSIVPVPNLPIAFFPLFAGLAMHRPPASRTAELCWMVAGPVSLGSITDCYRVNETCGYGANGRRHGSTMRRFQVFQVPELNLTIDKLPQLVGFLKLDTPISITVAVRIAFGFVILAYPRFRPDILPVIATTGIFLISAPFGFRSCLHEIEPCELAEQPKVPVPAGSRSGNFRYWGALRSFKVSVCDAVTILSGCIFLLQIAGTGSYLIPDAAPPGVIADPVHFAASQTLEYAEAAIFSVVHLSGLWCSKPMPMINSVSNRISDV